MYRPRIVSFITLILFLMSSVSGAQSQSDRLVALDVSHDRKIYATGSVNRVIRVYDGITNQLAVTFPDVLGIPDDTEAYLTYSIRDLEFNPEGSQIAVSYSNPFVLGGIIVIIQVSDGSFVFLEDRVASAVLQVSWSPDGIYLAATTTRGTFGLVNTYVNVWDVAAQAIVKTIELGNPDAGDGVALHPTEPKLAATSGRVIAIWDTQTWQIDDVVFRADTAINDIAWNQDGSRLAAVDLNGSVYIWDSATGESQLRSRTHARPNLFPLLNWSNNTVLVAATGLGIIEGWNTTSGDSVFKIQFDHYVTGIGWGMEDTLLSTTLNSTQPTITPPEDLTPRLNNSYG